MDRRLKALQLAALLCATAALMACGDATSTDADAESAHIEESEQGAGAPLDAPTLAKRAAAPKGTAHADDARLANDVLLQLVSDRNVDAQHFAIVVEQGVLYLMPTQDADAAEIEQAKQLVQAIEGISDIKVEKLDTPSREPDETTQEIVQAIEEAQQPVANAEEQDTKALTDRQDTMQADPTALEAAAELGKPAPKDDDNKDVEQKSEEPKAEVPSNQDAPAQEGEYREYTLRRGDSLSIVAARELGNGARWTEIYQLNRDVIGPNPDGVRDGMKIKLPVR